MRPLNILSMPLSGCSLVEASAGTGKTFTISNLILRAILLPQDGLKERPLTIEEILVVTFTKAATQELKDRIRAKILDAEAYLRDGKHNDALLVDIVSQAVNVSGIDITKQRCRQASLFLDDAPVFTIHGFCQRVLREYGFLTKQSYASELMENNAEFLDVTAEELWRECFYSARSEIQVLAKNTFKSPNGLYLFYKQYLDDNLHDALDVENQSEKFNKKAHRFLDCFRQAARIWHVQSEQIEEQLFQDNLGGSFRKDWVAGRLKETAEYLSDEAHSLCLWPDFHKDGGKVSKLGHAYMQSKIGKKFKGTLEHEFFYAIDSLLDEADGLHQCFLSYVRRKFIDLIAKKKREGGVIFFDDLVKNLSVAITEKSEKAGLLKSSLRKAYPLALIDEFQDTDQWQYDIFRNLYIQQPETGLLMIGDPKQAIYSFRGADIYTYFKARSDVPEERHFTLDTNWRSHQQLVGNVNSLFSRFEDAFSQKDFPEFLSVHSPESFSGWSGLKTSDGDSTLSSLKLDSDIKTTVENVRAQAAEKTAIFISQLIHSPAEINARQVQPKDIAVLVRDGKQAQIIREALREHGVNSVYLSKDSVLNSDEVAPFLRLLNAVAQPFNVSQIYTALGDSLLCRARDEISRIQQTPEAFQVLQASFIKAHDLWEKFGFMAMWYFVSETFDVATNCLKQEGGERRLTNLNQLAEIFQPLDNSHLVLVQQIDRFKKWVTEAEEDSETQKLRLETEANLVEIVTIHKSKGLQYPIVCCPFLFESATKKTSAGVTVQNPEQGTRDLHWYPNNSLASRSVLESFSEEIRVLYVALTRAQYHVNFTWGLCKGVEKSAMWHLLYHRDTKANDLSEETLWQAFASMPDFVLDPQIRSVGMVETYDSTDTDLTLKQLQNLIVESYVAGSYSALLSQHSHHQVIEEAADDENDVHTVISQPEFQQNIFHFPKGAEPGNFMHLLLENVSFQASKEEIAEEAEALMAYFRIDRELWLGVIAEHFSNLLTVKLDQDTFALSDLSEKQVLKELDFHMLARAVSGREIANLLSRYRQGEAVPEFNDIGGLFKGFIDLVFEYQGQYFVLDYKSNFLGYDAEAYTHEVMKEAMEGHFYDLQYLVYTAALQRYLKSRLPDYSYEKHIGGVYYLFLRGMKPDSSTGIYFSKPEAKLVSDVERFFFEGEFNLAGEFVDEV